VVTRAQIDQAVAALDATGRLIQDGHFDLLVSYLSGGRVGDTPRAPRPLPVAPKTFAVPKQPHLGRFAFLMHPPDMDEMVRCMPEGCEHYPPAQQKRLRQWIAGWHAFDGTPCAVHHLPHLGSRAGGYVDGWLVSCMLTPRDLMRLRPTERRALMQDYLRVARSVGANTIGLGAFTSVITRGGLDIADCEVPLTTGNSLTAMMCAEGLQLAAHRLGRPLRHQNVAIIGAAGSVGRVAALELASSCRRLVLFGNPGNPTAVDDVRSVAGEIYQLLLQLPEAGVPGDIGQDLRRLRASGTLPADLLHDRSPAACLSLAALVEKRFAQSMGRSAPIVVSVDLQRDLSLANAILSATSQGKPFVDAAWIQPDTIVCDAARPGDVGEHVRRQRGDLFVFDGGLVRLPEPVRFGRNNVLGFEAGINLACLSETMALTMEQVTRHHSLGRRIALEEARAIKAMAVRHGFSCHLPEPHAALLAGAESLLGSDHGLATL
jgi:predicted amino acid dehydrogenase